MFIVSHAFVDVAGKQMKYIVIVLLTMLKKKTTMFKMYFLFEMSRK